MCLYGRTTSQFFKFSDSQILKSRPRSRIPFYNSRCHWTRQATSLQFPSTLDAAMPRPYNFPVPRGIYYVSLAPFVPLYAALLHQCRSVLSLRQFLMYVFTEKGTGAAQECSTHRRDCCSNDPTHGSPSRS